MNHLAKRVPRCFDSSVRIVGASKIARDITEQKRAEVEPQPPSLRSSRDRHAIVSKDLSGVITSWNAVRTVVWISGRGGDRETNHYHHPKERQGEEPNILSRIRRGERVDHFRAVRRRKDGSLLAHFPNRSPITSGERARSSGLPKLPATSRNEKGRSGRHAMRRYCAMSSTRRKRSATRSPVTSTTTWVSG